MSKRTRFMLVALTGLTIVTAPSFAQSDAMRGQPMMGSDAKQGAMTGGGPMGGMMSPGMMMGEGASGPGMMGGGMMGDMMSGCPMKASGGATLNLPQLPPGNDALQFRMHAEMMQKVGEIAVRYADRIGTGK
ncbi:MAG: hypothetical protein LPJ91_11510 [Pseudazoarcus pumilus]|nr:hypothetical protein [Pseudazoarcus pumilus]